MPRQRQDTDFTVNVENIGQFTFGKRTMRDEVAIQVEYARLIDGVEPTAWLKAVCGWLSALSVLIVSAPSGWDMDSMDPLDDETYARLNQVYEALRERERSFRRGKTAVGEAGSPAAG